MTKNVTTILPVTAVAFELPPVSLKKPRTDTSRDGLRWKLSARAGAFFSISPGHVNIRYSTALREMAGLNQTTFVVVEQLNRLSNSD